MKIVDKAMNAQKALGRFQKFICCEKKRIARRRNEDEDSFNQFHVSDFFEIFQPS
jgi:hypothetical protein